MLDGVDGPAMNQLVHNASVIGSKDGNDTGELESTIIGTRS